MTSTGFLMSLAYALSVSGAAQNSATVPKRLVPSSVLSEMRVLEHRFEQALVQDCAPERCFPKGCLYGSHSVADQPPSASLPGLGDKLGPGSSGSQEYLTMAHCAFAHEKSVSIQDAYTIIRRLQAKLSKGWLVVKVSRVVLKPIPQSLREPPSQEQAEQTSTATQDNDESLVEPVQTPVQWDQQRATQELWEELLPHFSWMIAMALVTLATLLLIWGWRRLGKESVEEQMLMAQLLNTPNDTEASVGTGLDAASDQRTPSHHDLSPASESEKDERFVREQQLLWEQKLAVSDAASETSPIEHLISELLEAKEMGLLAKAMFLFPDGFPQAFPNNAHLASTKLELADYIKKVGENQLPTDAQFFARIKSYSLASNINAQGDAKIIRRLQDDYGAAGIVQLLGNQKPRIGALIFAFTSSSTQHEMVRLLSNRQVSELAIALLLSNRMDTGEAQKILNILSEDDNHEEPVESPSVSDQGKVFDAASALSSLLAHVTPDQRSGILARAKTYFNGTFPLWYGDILYPDMLLSLHGDERTNIFLSVDVRLLAHWLSTQTPANKSALLKDVAPSLSRALASVMIAASRVERFIDAKQARLQMLKALRRTHEAKNIPLEDALC
jgi:hypothetical protein